jgi:hypothetical protein
MKKWIAVLALVCGPAQAQFFSGNELYERLRDGRLSQVMFYVAGVHDANDKVLFCSPSDVTLGQALDVVKRYLETRPEQRHLSADFLASQAMRAAWPCRKGSGI